MNIRQTIIQDFENYIAHRKGSWGSITTFLFRNKKLTEEKVKIAEEMVKKLKKPDTIVESLLAEKCINHIIVSTSGGKKHFNFCPHGRKKDASQWEIEDIHSALTLRENKEPTWFSQTKWGEIPLYKNPYVDLCPDTPAYYLFGEAKEKDFEEYALTKKGFTVLKQTTPNNTFYFFSDAFYDSSPQLKTSKNRSHLADVFNNATHLLGAR
jgi:hypothetical protein